MNDSILFWNQVALDACKADFSFPDPLPTPRPADTVPEQAGPTYASRALAIVHLAMYDAFTGANNATGARQTYLDYGSSLPAAGISLTAARAAVAAAACLTLIGMFSRQRATFLARHAEFTATLGGGADVAAGLAWGTLVGNQMMAARSGDGATASNELYAPGAEACAHRPDPLNPGQGFLGPKWGAVAAFGFENIRTALTPLPAPKTLAQFTGDFIAVKEKGRKEGSTRSTEETTIGLFWAYDGARNIGVPPRLYNQVVRRIVETKGNVSEAQNARLFAMVNVAMADAGIQAWHEKYRHNLWRPVLGIREADAGWGPTGLGDGNSGTIGDPYWEPLGAPRTNSSGPAAFTPNFPAYPSGHATFGTAALRVVQAELGLAENFAFSFVSDELNGSSVGAQGVRPRHERRLTIASAIEENILSRVYLGVHWEFDGRMGAQIGEEIASKLVPAFPMKA